MNAQYHLPLTLLIAFNGAVADEPVVIKSALVTLIDEVEVPAREAGILEKALVREGGTVKTGDLLATIDDNRAKLARNRAEIELRAAKHRAGNDVPIRLAEKIRAVAIAELKRAEGSQNRVAKSISQSELDRLRLAVERATLEIENARHEFDAAKLAVELTENELCVADDDVARCRVLSPIDGVVVQVYRKRSEWVQPGDVLFRVVRMDRLRLEGLLDVKFVTNDLLDRKATFRLNMPEGGELQLPAQIVFVHPEVNKINGQVRIWAEVENFDGVLRPGLVGALTIEASEHESDKGTGSMPN
jgi:macrolide-specific efflux system membrane fusion protein